MCVYGIRGNVAIFDLQHVGKNFCCRSFRKLCLTDINCLQLLAVREVGGCQGFPFLQQIDSLTGTTLQNSLVRNVASLMMFPSCPHVLRPSENMWELSCPEGPRKLKIDSPWRTIQCSAFELFFSFSFLKWDGPFRDCMRHRCYLWQRSDDHYITDCQTGNLNAIAVKKRHHQISV